MLLKNLSLLSLAIVVAADATVTNLNLRENGRSLQAAAACIIGGTPFEECCPSAKPDDGICTLLWCVDLDGLKVRDNCGCGQIVTACEQISLLTAAVDGLTEMCASVTNCCGGDGTDNAEFDTCLGAAISDGDFTLPDFDTLIPGGIPDIFGGIDNATDALPELIDTDTVTTPFEGGDNATDALAELIDAVTSPEESTTAATTAAGVTTTATTVAPGDSTDAIEEPDDTNGASGNDYAVKTLISLIGSSLAMILV